MRDATPDAAVEAGARPDARPRVSVHPVRSAAVGEIWRHIEPMIRAAVDEGPGDETVADILEKLARRDYQMWVVLLESEVAAVVVTSLRVAPRRKIVRIEYLGGQDADVWIQTLGDSLSAWAKANGCSHLEAGGRKGWMKLLKKIGGEPSYTVYRKKI